MKSKKRILSLILAFVMVAALVPAITVSAGPHGTVSVAVAGAGAGNTVQQGGTFTLNVEMTGNTVAGGWGVMGLDIEVPAGLEFVSTTTAPGMPAFATGFVAPTGWEGTAGGNLVYRWMDVMGFTTTNHPVVSVVLRVPAATAPGTDFPINFYLGRGGSFIDADGEPMDVTAPSPVIIQVEAAAVPTPTPTQAPPTPTPTAAAPAPTPTQEPPTVDPTPTPRPDRPRPPRPGGVGGGGGAGLRPGGIVARPPVGAPGGVRNVGVTVGLDQARVTWTAPLTGGNVAFDLRFRFPGEDWTVIEGITTTSYTITDLFDADLYEFQVRAVNDAGEGQWVSVGEVPGVPDVQPPTIEPPVITPVQPPVIIPPIAVQPVAMRFVIGDATYTRDGMALQAPAAPFIREGRTMVPLRVLVEGLNGTVTWNEATRTATAMLGGRVVNIPLDVPFPGNYGTPTTVNDRMFVPANWVASQLGANVTWDEANQAVFVNLVG